jgi:hypothetical protein
MAGPIPQGIANQLGLTATNPGMGFNFDAPMVPATSTQPVTYNMNTNEILGLKNSTKYPSLQEVGDTGYYYRDNYMYEPYTVTSSPPSHMGGFYGYGYGTGGGGSNRAEGTIEIGGQAFRPVTDDVNVKGFTAFTPENGPTQYTPSMAYLYANTPKYVPKPIENVGLYLAANEAYGDKYGDILQPTQANLLNNPYGDYYSDPRTSYGAARFLNNYADNLLGTNNDTTGSNTESA